MHLFLFRLTFAKEIGFKPNTFSEFLSIVQNQIQYYIRAHLQQSQGITIPPAEFLTVSGELAKITSYWPIKPEMQV